MNDSDDDVTAIQKTMTAEVKQDLTNLGPVLIQSKIEQQQLLMQSTAQGGPASTPEAIMLILDYVKLSVRELSAKLKMNRKKLQAMVEGRADMPPELIGKIWDVIEKKRPGLLDRLKNMTFDD